jgi:hypothetical protein
MIVGQVGVGTGDVGISEASHMYSPSTPRTSPRSFVTAIAMTFCASMAEHLELARGTIVRPAPQPEDLSVDKLRCHQFEPLSSTIQSWQTVVVHE